MTTQPNFRPARPADMDTIIEIAMLAWEPIYAFRRERLGADFFERAFPAWREAKARELRSLAAEHPENIWVTEEDGRILAFTSFHIDEKRGIGTLGNNAVRPEAQGRGIGSRQHKAVLELFREKGLVYAVVLTGLDPAHAPARASYEKMGFRPMMETVKYYREV